MSSVCLNLQSYKLLLLFSFCWSLAEIYLFHHQQDFQGSELVGILLDLLKQKDIAGVFQLGELLSSFFQ